MNKENQNQVKKEASLFDKAIDIISGIFLPVINVLMAAALLKGILLLLVNTGLILETSGAYQIIYAIADGFFYFFPIFLAYTASHKLKADSFTSVLIATTLVYPSITKLFEHGTALDFFGIPVGVVTYPSSVIPIILAVAFQHYVELPLEKYIHSSIKGFLKPMICVVIVTPITFLVFGPLGALIGNGLSDAYSAIYNFNPVIAGAIFGLIWQPVVVFGLHWGMVPVILEHVSTLGRDSFLPLVAAAVTGQAGAAMAVSIMAKNKKLKTVALSCGITALLGVTEPTLYGITVPLKRPMIAACIGGSIGGAIVGTSNAGAVAYAYPSLVSLVVYFGEGFWTMLISMVVGFVIGMAMTFLLRFNEADFKAGEIEAEATK